ncbi:DNA-binding GntR family transcriptional regulator [Paraburkholderia graminis]|jgi:DNA-binding GntR family transcriptional regulator|uniref:DNA-binding GntR family transcriptional regulator n=2 Tax=Paraburkholderia graminis TaxID=60548 RepID=A0ABD5CGG9_9BURK|nr:DNA-binding GntR family transcriptional regulator [Paraburkholderia graminis]
MSHLLSPPMSDLRIDRNAKTLRELTLEKLRGAIVQGYFRPGARLVERTLCDELGVSRTVVREVLRHLETEGLVEIVARQGPIVARLDPDQVAETYELRGLLEANAARACAEQSTPELVARLRGLRKTIEDAFAKNDLPRVLEYTELFYDAMFEGAQKHVSLSVVKTLNARINRLRALTIATPGRGDESNQEMNALLDAIERRDGEAAAAASAAHIKRAGELAMTALAQQTQPAESD